MTATSGIPTDSNVAGLRQKVDQFVGLFFYGTLLKGARSHKLTGSKLGFGGRGEEAFGAQLDQELAQRAGGASHNSLNEAMVRQLSAKMPDAGGKKLSVPALAGRLAPGNSQADAGMAARRYMMPHPAGQKLDMKH